MSERERLEQSIHALEAQRGSLGDEVVDPALAAMRKQMAELEASSAAPLKRAERKPVTILFADLSGFTTLSEQLDPEAARRLMNACFDTVKEVIDCYGGHIDKYIGDEVMVLFGAPTACEDHAERALRAALAVRERVKSFKFQVSSLELMPCSETPPAESSNIQLDIDIHIGVNSGLVVAGGIGAQGSQQYSVIGDAVNVAARLTELSTSGQILVGEASYNLVAPLFDFRPLPPLTLKGKQMPQWVYELVGPKTQPGRVRGLEGLGLRAPMVGRDEELGRLEAILARLQTGQGSLVGIVGEAGVGKSRFVAELRQHSGTLSPKGTTRPVQWVEGRCLSYGEMLSYHPFLDLLRSLIGVAPEAEAGLLETRLRVFLDDLLPGRTHELYPYLADFLGLPLPPAEQERLEAMAGESRQWQIFQIFETLLLHLSRRAPLVVVMEDLHWVDPTSAVLLEQLLPKTSQNPLVFLLVQRPFGCSACEKLLHTLRAEPACRFEEISLAPLSAEGSQALIGHLLAVEALPEAMRTLILERAEGNPLYLEEILRALISQGVLLRQDDRWSAAPGVELAQIDIPTTLQGVILARLDRLEDETKLVLQMAAVIGRIFWYRVLDYILAIEQRMQHVLGTHLTRLEQVELIRETRQHPDLEYIFKHILIQDAAYHSVLKEQRQRFHQRVAEALEFIFADSLEEQYGLLAHHYQAAGQVELAVRYLQLAGDHARRAYALDEAAAYYRRALDLILPEDRQARQPLLFKLGLVDMTRGDFARAGEYYAAAFACQPASSSLQRAYAKRPLRLVLGNPMTLEPGMSLDLDSNLAVQQLFAGLVEFDPELNIVPHMAERWELDDDGRTYRFHLRRDARWSDGAPLTAHDFVYAWRRWLQPDSASQLVQWLYVLRGAQDFHQGRSGDPATVGVRALDELTLEVELEEPLAYFLSLLVGTVFYPLPRHRWPPPRSPEEEPEGWVGNAPFRLAAWRPGERVVFERNPYYCGRSDGNVDRVETLYWKNGMNAVELYQAGELDVCEVNRVEEVTAFERIVPPECWLHKPGLYTRYCGLLPTPPLDDRRVRRALALAVDRSRLAAIVSETTARLAWGGYVPPGMPGHSPELAPPYAPEQARTLLREAGYAGGRALPTLRCVLFSPEDPLALALAAQWREALGVECVMERRLLSSLSSQLQDDPPHLFINSWLADYPDPHNFLAQGLVGLNTWQAPSYWAKVAQAAGTLDVRKRMALYHELDRQLVAEDALCIPLTYQRNSFVLGPHVRRFFVWPVAYASFKDVVME
ncbi:MAG: AAA family ATPase [Thermoflexales bacterium]|nr:AAA family ATPase [Thermoflexales bacterium]